MKNKSLIIIGVFLLFAAIVYFFVWQKKNMQTVANASKPAPMPTIIPGASPATTTEANKIPSMSNTKIESANVGVSVNLGKN